jgi:hypothetical protein
MKLMINEKQNFNKLNNIQSFNTKDTTMKKLTLLIALLLVVGLSTNAFAQASATATATATIVAPITISKTIDMNFGNVATNGAIGTVILTPASGRSVTGGATLVGVASVAAASFNVGGQGTYTYAITLPAGPITLTGVTAGVTAGTFTSTPSGTGALTAGAQTLLVGATLNLPATPVTAGAYTSAAFTVTVNYN